MVMDDDISVATVMDEAHLIGITFDDVLPCESISNVCCPLIGLKLDDVIQRGIQIVI